MNSKCAPEDRNSPLADTPGSAFVIQRSEYPDWFAGWNAYGPIWTSSFDQAVAVRPDLLVGYMGQLAAHKPCASLLPNARGQAQPLTATVPDKNNV